MRNYLTDSYFDISDCYFYSFDFCKESYQNIIADGLKSKILLKHIDKEGTNNGSFYVSLLKIDTHYNDLSILEDNPLLIIDKSVRVIKTSNNRFYNLFSNTPFPLRYSPYNNEYQKFLKISSKHILGIAFNINRENEIENLKQMKELLLWEKEINKDTLFMDRNSNRVIDKHSMVLK